MSGYTTDLAKLENNRNCLRRIARHDEPQFSKDSIVNVMEKFVKTVNVMDNTILVPCRLMDRQVGDGTDVLATPGKNSTSNQLTINSCAHGKRSVTQSKNVHEFLNSSELFNLYNMLNALKKDLLWTGKDNVDVDDDDTEYVTGITVTESKTESVAEPLTTITAANNNNSSNANGTTNNSGTVKGHIRRPSTASVASTASVSNLSDSESDISNENDSGVEFEGGNKSDNAQSSSSDGSISSSDDVRAQKKAANLDKATDLAQRCRKHLTGLYQCLEQMTEAANYLTARYQSDIGPV